MELNQVITLTTNVEVVINSILNDVGIMTLKADILPDGTINYFMFGIPVEQVPQPLDTVVQNVLDQFKQTVIQKATDAGYI